MLLFITGRQRGVAVLSAEGQKVKQEKRFIDIVNRTPKPQKVPPPIEQKFDFVQ